MKGKGENERYTHLNAKCQRIARRGKKAVLSDQCKEKEENNRMGKTTDLFGRRKWQPTPVLLPREFRGQRSLVGCCPQGRTESDMTEATSAAAAALNLLQYCFCFMFWFFGPERCGIVVS